MSIALGLRPGSEIKYERNFGQVLGLCKFCIATAYDHRSTNHTKVAQGPYVSNHALLDRHWAHEISIVRMNMPLNLERCEAVA